MTNTCSFNNPYDQIVGSSLADFSFYVKEPKVANPPVLALVCAPPARTGVVVWGMDVTTVTLNLARRKVTALTAEVPGRVNLLQGDMHGSYRAPFDESCSELVWMAGQGR